MANIFDPNDQQLRQPPGVQPPAAAQFVAAPAPPPVVAAEFPGDDAGSKVVVLEQADGEAELSPESMRKRREAQRFALVGVLCVGLVLVAAAMVWKAGARNRVTEPDMSVVVRERRLVDVKEGTAPGKRDGGSTATSDPTRPPPKAVDGSSTDHASPKPHEPLPPPANQSEAPRGSSAPQQPRPVVEDVAKVPAEVADRRVVPSAEEQTVIAKLLAESYPLAADAAAADKLRVAKELLSQAGRSGTTANERFVLLRRVSDLACDAGDAAMMLQALDVIGAEYVVDSLKAKEKYLLKFGENSTDSVRIGALVEASKQFTADASAGERFDLALSVATSANQACQRSVGKAYRKETMERLQRVQQRHSQYASVRESLAALGTSPGGDPAQNLNVGRWYALACGKWDKGLPYLAKGNDDGFAKAARCEIEHANTPEDEVKVGDTWWDLAQDSQGEDREALLRHAGAWYQKTRENFTAGFTRIKIDKRLADIAKVTGEGGDDPAGGNQGLPLNQWIDILGSVDLERDAAVGQWKRIGESVAVAKGDFARLCLPVKIPRGNYDIEVELNRADGNDAVAVILPLPPRQCAFVLGAANGTANGLELVSGMPVTNSNNLTASRPGALTNNRNTKVLIKVRRDDEKARIDVILNAKSYPPAGGPLRELSLPDTWWIADAQRPAIGVHQGAVTFRRVRLRLLSGEGMFVTGKSATGGLPAADATF